MLRQKQMIQMHKSNLIVLGDIMLQQAFQNKDAKDGKRVVTDTECNDNGNRLKNSTKEEKSRRNERDMERRRNPQSTACLKDKLAKRLATA